MAIRTFGLEEELHLVDPSTGETTARSPEVLKIFGERATTPPGDCPRPASDELDAELFRHQLETRTDPVLAGDDALSQLLAARRTAAGAARAADAAVVAAGTLPLAARPAVVSPQDRYRDIVHRYGEIGRAAGTCGMHVHVGIDSDEEGVAVIDRIAPVAAGAARGERELAVRRRERHRATPRGVRRSGRAGRPRGHRSRSAARSATGRWRPRSRSTARRATPACSTSTPASSTAHPTVEIRVADVCTDPADAVLIALLARGLVETLAQRWQRGEPVAEHRTDLLRAAHWRASRLRPGRHAGAPGGGCPAARPRGAGGPRRAEVRPALEESGDPEPVTDGVARVLAAGGASRQRAAFERTGELAAVVRRPGRAHARRGTRLVILGCGAMGEEVEAQEFSRADRTRHREKVRRCLDVFARMLREARFDTDDPMTGLEVELNLVDERGDPALKNAEALDAIADPDFQTELGQFNIEINVPPARLREGGLATFEETLRAQPQRRRGNARPRSAPTW